MAKFANGQYTPKNPEKYIGKGLPHYRSSWEFMFMQFVDNHPSVMHWSSESIRIPYRNPLSGKATTYVPDFFIIYQDKDGQTHAEIIEIKPSGQSTVESARGAKNKAAAIINMAKWQSARAYCGSKGITFRIVTEKDLFANGKR